MESGAWWMAASGAEEPRRVADEANWLRAWHLLRRHRPWLIEGAARYARERPREPLAALVVDGDLPEARQLHPKIGLAAARVSVGIVQPRVNARELLTRHAPAHALWQLADPPGPRRPLPIVVIARSAVLYDLAYYVAPA